MGKKQIREEVKIEIENLARLKKEMDQLLVKISDQPNFIEVRAAASILHDFYCGVEKIFERIALFLDKKIPKGEEWHSELLRQMAASAEGGREAVIPDELFQRLKEYLRFRHLFRHIYGFELKWERFKSLCILMGDLLEDLNLNLKRFLK